MNLRTFIKGRRTFWLPAVLFLFLFLAQAYACFVMDLKDDEVLISIKRVGKFDLDKIKILLGKEYYANSGKKIVFRCVDGRVCDLMVGNEDVSFRLGDIKGSKEKGVVVLGHLLWLKANQAAEISIENINMITKLVQKYEDTGYHIGYGHEDPWYAAGDCIEQVIGRNAPCAENCVQKNLFSVDCDRACSDRVRKSRMDCYFSCDAKIVECHKEKIKDKWVAMGSNSYIEGDGIVVSLRCMSSAVSIERKPPSLSKDFSEEIKASIVSLGELS